MPYKSIRELPEAVRNSLPESAQRIWMNAYNYAVANPEKVKGEPAQYAWGAVKTRFRKEGDRWVKNALSIDNITEADFEILEGMDLVEAAAIAIRFLEEHQDPKKV